MTNQTNEQTGTTFTNPEPRYVALIQFAINEGHAISVQDEDDVESDEFLIHQSLDFKAVMDALNHTSTAAVFIGKADEVVATAGINVYATEEVYGGLYELCPTDIGEHFVRAFLATQIKVTDTTMLKACEHLVRYAIELGSTVSVFDGEEWQVKRSRDYKDIVDAIESVDEAELTIRGADGAKLFWARVSAYGLANDETIIDCSANDYMTACDDDYELAGANRDAALAAATFPLSFILKFKPTLEDCSNLQMDNRPRLWTIERNGEQIFSPFRSTCGRFLVEPSVYDMSYVEANFLNAANEAIIPNCTNL